MAHNPFEGGFVFGGEDYEFVLEDLYIPETGYEYRLEDEVDPLDAVKVAFADDTTQSFVMLRIYRVGPGSEDMPLGALVAAVRAVTKAIPPQYSMSEARVISAESDNSVVQFSLTRGG